MPEFDSGSGGGSSGWTCEDAPVRVFVDGTEIPTVEVNTWISREGVLDINVLSEIHYPSTWRDRSVTSVIDAFEPNSQQSYDIVDVVYQGSGFKRHVQRGYLRGVGGSSQGTGLMKGWVSGPETLLTAIPFSGVYTEPTVEQLLGDIIDVFRERTLFEDVTLRTSAPSAVVSETPTSELTDGASSLDEAISNAIRLLQLTSPQGHVSGTQRHFKSNRDTLADACKWLTGVNGGFVYFSVSEGGGLELVYDKTATHKGLSDTELGGSVKVIENDAIEEIMPFSQVEVLGATGASLGGHDLAFVPGKRYPYVRAVYPPLQNRIGVAGEPPVIEASATTLGSAKSVARRKLKESLQTHGQGDILVDGNPTPNVFDRLEAHPSCAGQSRGRPFTYEVQGVEHSSVEGNYRTRLNVSTYVDYDQIEIEEAHMKEQ